MEPLKYRGRIILKNNGENMKKKRNIIIVTVIVLAFLFAFGFVVVRLLQDENAYNVTEKKYMIDKKSNVISINIINDANVFGRDGKGLYYDFLKDFEKENGLSFNIVTTSLNNTINGLTLSKSTELPQNAKLFYTDHYVLVSKNDVDIKSIGEISDTIGYLDKDKNQVSKIINEHSLVLKNYSNKEEMLAGLSKDEVKYIIVPMLEYLDVIFENLYAINYHLSDLKDYYFLQYSDDKVLASIFSKFYNKWNLEKGLDTFNAHEYSLFTDKLKITEKELDVINNKKYKYGFIDYAPYDIKLGGVYGGITSKYIKSFADFSGLEFDYYKYGNFEKLKKSVNNGVMDLFLNYFGIESSYASINSLYGIDISIVMNNNDKRVIRSLDGLKGTTVYTKKNSQLVKILNNYGISTIEYKRDKDLKKIFKKNGIVALGYGDYLIYKETNKNVNERFRINAGNNLKFQSNNDTMFNRLFYYYVSTLDKNEILYTGIDDYHNTIMSGTLIYKIAKYAFLLILVIGLVVYLFYRLGKKALVRKRIKRSDKMKYIDMLTSLKNRNYLNENIPIWNQNTIYPQTIIVVDLNGIQVLNDTYGYAEGDKQIQAAANVLIKTQLDNSEIMRTDGNEFTIYMVGYSEKQVISYIKKLNKEFKNLPHDKRAAIGFSMIESDEILLNDAINVATEKMKENKELITMGEEDGEKI